MSKNKMQQKFVSYVRYISFTSTKRNNDMSGEQMYEDFINGLAHGCYEMTEEENETVAFEVPAHAIDENGDIDFSKL